MDLVEEKDRPAAAAAETLAGLREHLAHVRDRRGDRRQLLELGAGRVRDDPCQCRLARAGRPVEDQRRNAVLLDREAERPAGTDHVLLPDEVVEGRRAQPLRERRRGLEPPSGRLAEEVTHAGSMLSAVAAER